MLQCARTKLPMLGERVSYADFAAAIANIHTQLKDPELAKEAKVGEEASSYITAQLPAVTAAMLDFYTTISGAGIPASLRFKLGYSGAKENEHDRKTRELWQFVDDLTGTLNVSYYSAHGAKAAGPVGAVPAGHQRITYMGFSVDVRSAVGLDTIDEKKIIAAVQDSSQRHRSSNCTGQPAGNNWWYTHDYGRNRLLLVAAFDESTNPKRVEITKAGSVNDGVHNFK